MTLELDEGIRIVVDLDEPESAYLSLHRARTRLDGPPATRPTTARPPWFSADHR